MISKYFKTTIFALAGLVILSSCEKNPPAGPTYNVPSTYNFENVDYSGQTERLEMTSELSSYMKTANNGAVLDAQKMKDMYVNQNNPFSKAELNSSTKQIKDKTFMADQALFETWFDELAAASASTTAGSNGTAGVVTSNSGAKKYLFDENGLERIQYIEKGLMGALMYYQSTAVYLGNEKIGPTVDNSTVTPGKGTAMEHHWDEAFGYFGAPTDFPANKTGAQFWAKYSNTVDPHLNSNATIMNAFIKGRAAISNKDMAAKDEAVQTIRTEWERVTVATAIYYLNGAKADFGDDAIRNHQLSEAAAFIMCIKYNPSRKMEINEINSLLETLGDNFYEVTIADINAVRDQLSARYNMDSIKNNL